MDIQLIKTDFVKNSGTYTLMKYIKMWSVKYINEQQNFVIIIKTVCFTWNIFSRYLYRRISFINTCSQLFIISILISSGVLKIQASVLCGPSPSCDSVPPGTVIHNVNTLPSGYVQNIPFLYCRLYTNKLKFFHYF